MSRLKMLESVWRVEGEEVARTALDFDADQANAVLDALLKAKRGGNRIFVAGVGTSAAAARKIAHSLCCIEFPSAFLSPGDAVHGGLGAVQTGDVAILISKGGSTREIVNMLPGLKAKRAVTIAVTENAESSIGTGCDFPVLIRARREPDAFNMLATASTLKVIAYFDAIAIVLMEESGYTKEQFAVIHPGGAVGDRLLGHTN